MTKQERQEILNYGMKYGVTQACRQYGISRTIYYRWLKRYEMYGYDGLEDKKRKFTPKNKATPELENIVLNSICKYPEFGPQSICWLIEKEGYKISTSGVYNIMKRHGLNHKEKRIEYMRYKKTLNSKDDEFYVEEVLPCPKDAKVGELWICWTNGWGYIPRVGNVYQYSIVDARSCIAFSRLYIYKNTECALDVIFGVAMPMGNDLNMKPKWVITKRDKEYTSGRLQGNHLYTKTLRDFGIKQLLCSEEDKDYAEIVKKFSKRCLNFYNTQVLNREISFQDIKVRFQDFIRNYNFNTPLDYGIYKGKTPFEIVVCESDDDILLPLWTYVNRMY